LHQQLAVYSDSRGRTTRRGTQQVALAKIWTKKPTAWVGEEQFAGFGFWHFAVSENGADRPDHILVIVWGQDLKVKVVAPEGALKFASSH
jgi:hypothetical protein